MKTKENPEMPMVPKAYLKTVEHQRDQYKSERDTLIDDIAVLKAKVSRLERENGQLKKEEKVNRTKASLLTEIERLKEKNEKLDETVNTCCEEYNGLGERSKSLEEENRALQSVISKYITLTDHIRLKAEMNPSVSRYIDLVNYVDRLEGADDEKI